MACSSPRYNYHYKDERTKKLFLYFLTIGLFESAPIGSTNVVLPQTILTAIDLKDDPAEGKSPSTLAPSSEGLPVQANLIKAETSNHTDVKKVVTRNAYCQTDPEMPPPVQAMRPKVVPSNPSAQFEPNPQVFTTGDSDADKNSAARKLFEEPAGKNAFPDSSISPVPKQTTESSILNESHLTDVTAFDEGNVTPPVSDDEAEQAVVTVPDKNDGLDMFTAPSATGALFDWNSFSNKSNVGLDISSAEIDPGARLAMVTETDPRQEDEETAARGIDLKQSTGGNGGSDGGNVFDWNMFGSKSTVADAAPAKPVNETERGPEVWLSLFKCFAVEK